MEFMIAMCQHTGNISEVRSPLIMAARKSLRTKYQLHGFIHLLMYSYLVRLAKNSGRIIE